MPQPAKARRAVPRSPTPLESHICKKRVRLGLSTISRHFAPDKLLFSKIECAFDEDKLVSFMIEAALAAAKYEESKAEAISASV